MTRKTKIDTGRMTLREHPTRAAAIAEAVKHGYWTQAGIRRDGHLILANGKRPLAILRETRARSVVYHLVDAPPDAAEPIEDVQICLTT